MSPPRRKVAARTGTEGVVEGRNASARPVLLDKRHQRPIVGADGREPLRRIYVDQRHDAGAGRAVVGVVQADHAAMRVLAGSPQEVDPVLAGPEERFSIDDRRLHLCTPLCSCVATLPHPNPPPC